MSKFVNKLEGLLRSIGEGKSPEEMALKARKEEAKLNKAKLRNEREKLRDTQQTDTDNLSAGKSTKGGALSRLTKALDKLADG